MSTTFSIKESTLSANSGIYFGVNSLRRAIAEAIQRRMRELGDLNPSQVAKRSRDQITSAGVRNVLKAESGVMVETLIILAEALDTTAPQLLIEALSPKPESVAEAENLRLLTFYFRHVPEICQLYIVASARGVYQCQNTDAKIFERAAARSATRATLKTDINELTAADAGREAVVLSPHPPDEVIVSGRIVMQDADSLAGDDAYDEDTNTERERKSA